LAKVAPDHRTWQTEARDWDARTARATNLTVGKILAARPTPAARLARSNLGAGRPRGGRSTAGNTSARGDPDVDDDPDGEGAGPPFEEFCELHPGLDGPALLGAFGELPPLEQEAHWRALRAEIERLRAGEEEAP